MLKIRPITFRAACAFIAQHHRHHKKPTGHKFSIGVEQDGMLVGVACVGRPSARAYDDGRQGEVIRTCTDGTFNANSMLYGAVRRICTEMGYTRLFTYIQAEEGGASLRAAGWWKSKDLAARKSWAESTKDEALKAMRDPVGTGGVARELWEWKR